MKGNTDTIVYLIIIIVSILFSLIKKNKEKQTKQKVANKPNQINSSDIFSSILGGNPDFNEEQIEESDENTETPKEDVQLIEKLDTKHVVTTDKPIKGDKITNDAYLLEQEAVEDFNVLEEFDLLRAIVYTEILKRKDF